MVKKFKIALERRRVTIFTEEDAYDFIENYAIFEGFTKVDYDEKKGNIERFTLVNEESEIGIKGCIREVIE